MAIRYVPLGPLLSGEGSRAYLGLRVVDGEASPCALVWAPDDVLGDPERVERLRRDTYRVAELGHPNIVRVFGLAEVDGGVARAVEYADGESLRRVLEVAKRLPPAFAARAACDAALGVEHAHMGRDEHGAPLVHGDLRPETLLVTYSGVTKVSGYGALSVAPRELYGRRVVGRRRHCAPEQILGGRYAATPQTDVYLLGVVLYEALTGEIPFQEEEDFDLAVVTQQPKLLGSALVPPKLRSVLEKAMEKKASLRFAGAQAFREAVEEAAGGLPERSELAGFLVGAFSGDGARAARERLLRSGLKQWAAGAFTPSPESAAAHASAAAEPAEDVAAHPGVREPAPAEAPGAAPAAAPEGATAPPPAPAAPESADGEAEAPAGAAVPAAEAEGLPAPRPGAATVEGPEPDPECAPAHAAALPPPPPEVAAPAAPAQEAAPPVARVQLYEAPVPAAAARAEPRPDDQRAPRRDAARSPRRSGVAWLVAPPLVVAIAAGAFWMGRRGAHGEAERGAPISQQVAATAPPASPPRTDLPDRGAQPREEQEARKVATAPRPRAKATLEIVTTPPLAVSIDGEHAGRSPVKVDVAPGPHRMALADPARGIRVTRTIHAKAGANRLALKLGSGTLTVNAPPGCEVRVDGRLAGKTPLDGPLTVFEGSHRIQVSLGDARWQQAFSIRDGDQLSADVQFQPRGNR